MPRHQNIAASRKTQVGPIEQSPSAMEERKHSVIGSAPWH
jgi:hypothetical protein